MSMSTAPSRNPSATSKMLTRQADFHSTPCWKLAKCFQIVQPFIPKRSGDVLSNASVESVFPGDMLNLGKSACAVVSRPSRIQFTPYSLCWVSKVSDLGLTSTAKTGKMLGAAWPWQPSKDDLHGSNIATSSSYGPSTNLKLGLSKASNSEIPFMHQSKNGPQMSTVAMKWHQA